MASMEAVGVVSGLRPTRIVSKKRTGLLQEPIDLVLPDEVVLCWLEAEPAHYACVVSSGVQEVKGQQVRLRAIARD